MAQDKLYIPNFIVKMAATFKVAEKEEKESLDDDTKIKVSRVVGKVSLIYEKLRNVVDYNDEHLLRKNAIFRILKRLMLLERRTDKIGLILLQELIRINYLPNNTIPESRTKEVDTIIKKYLVLDEIGHRAYKSQAAYKLNVWFLHIAACEIEDLLFDFHQRQALTLAMVKVLRQDVGLPETINEKDQQLLFNLAVLRSLLKSDEVILYYYLLSELYPNFLSVEPNREELTKMVCSWQAVKGKMDYYLNHPFRNKLGRIARKYAVYFLILRDVLQDDPKQIDQILTHPKVLEAKVAEICQRRYKEIRAKVVRSVFRSIVYIFITKMALALVLEVPVDYFLEQSLNYTALLVNITFPPFLMLAISLFIVLPKKKNTEKIAQKINEIVYQSGSGEQKYQLKPKEGRGSVLNLFFHLFYFLVYGLTFGAVVWFLRLINFNYLSGAIFIFFLCVVSFFAVNIRYKARELIVLDRKEGLINFLFDLFSLPIVRIGQWLSIKISKINIFVYFLDFIVEAPLKIILEVIERWFSFIREKKEEIY
ncbi:MAG: hypothetical protein WCT37_02845 [Patescibacteria group bacterium]|jgi:hypothetical protein